MRTISSLRRPLAALALTAAFVVPTGLVASGCGGDSDSSGVAQAETSASSTGTTDSTTATTGTGTTADSEQALLNFASCMRKEGVDFPDPQPDSEGNLADVDQGALQAAQEACQDELQGAQGALGADQTELNDAFLEFAQCMRENGVDVPDPEPGQAPGAGGAQIDQNDPDFQTAIDACQDLIPTPGGDG
jgi:hypothetical protein